MPPDATSILHAELIEFRREANDNFRRLREAVEGYDAAKCAAHTDRMGRVETRLDTAAAAMEALAKQRESDRAQSGSRWQRAAVVIALVSALGALVVPFFR